MCLKKLLLSLIIFCGSLIILTGCWDRVEINDLAIVTAAAIDKTDNKVEVSLQIFIPKALSSGGAGGPGGGGGSPVTLVANQKGVNIADALSKLQGDLPRKMFWGQCKVFIFGEALAKDGIEEHLDFLLRYAETRERALVFVTKGMGKSMLEIQTLLERDSSEVVREQAKLIDKMNITLQNLDETQSSNGLAGIAPYITISTKKEQNKESRKLPKISGIAIIHKNKMVGTMSDGEKRGILWLRNELRDYTVTFKPNGSKGEVSIKQKSAHIKMTPIIHNNKWKMTVKIKTEGTVVQNGTNLNISDPVIAQRLEQAFEDDIKKRIHLAINKVQKELNADILGFAKEFHRKYPKQWKKEKNNWDEIFPTIEVMVKVEAHIRNEGEINRLAMR